MKSNNCFFVHYCSVFESIVLSKGTAHLNCKTTTYEVKLQSCDIPIDSEQIVAAEWGGSVYAHVVLRTVAEEVFRSFN